MRTINLLPPQSPSGVRQIAVAIAAASFTLFAAVSVAAAAPEAPVNANRAPPEIVLPIGHAYLIQSVAFSPDGRFVLSGSYDRTAILWNAATGERIRTYVGHQGDICSVAFSPDGSKILTGSGDATAVLWDLRDGRQLRVFHGPTGKIEQGIVAAFTPDGRQVLTGSEVGEGDTLVLWDAETGAKIRSFTDRDARAVTSIVVTPDGSGALTASKHDGRATLCDIKTGKKLRTFSADRFDYCQSIAISRDAKLVAAVLEDCSILALFDLSTGKTIRTLHTTKIHSTTYNRAGHVAFTPDGKDVAVESGRNGGGREVFYWSVGSGKLIRKLADKESMSGPLTFSPDGRQLLVGDVLCDAATCRMLRRLQAVDRRGRVMFTQNGRQLLTGGRPGFMWNLAGAGEAQVVGDAKQRADVAALTRDGSQFLTSDGANICIWDARALRKQFQFGCDNATVTCAEFNPDGKEVITGLANPHPVYYISLHLV